MKKRGFLWLWMLLFTLAVIAPAGRARAEEPSISLTVTNAEAGEDGTYRTKYAYAGEIRITGADSDVFWDGWGDPDAEEPAPESVREERLSEWEDYAESGGVQTAPFLTRPDERDGIWEDAWFVRLSEEDPWQKVVFYYNADAEKAEAAVITSGDDLVLGEPYTLTWDPVEEAEYYLVWWQFPNGLLRARYVPAEETSCEISADEDGVEWTSAIGTYECWVETWAPHTGKAPAESDHKELTAEAPEETGEITVRVEGLDEDGETGEASVPLYRNLWFEAEAPGADRIVFCDGIRSWDYEADEEGRVEFEWNPTEEEAEYYTVYLKAYYPDGSRAFSAPISFRAAQNSEIEGDVTYRVIGEPNEDGEIEAARDGLLTLEADPIDGVRYFCAFLVDGEDRWITDTHWVDANPDRPTELLLPVAACEPGGSYGVGVYAVQYGAPQKQSEKLTKIRVTEPAAQSDILISMKDTFRVYEPLRIAAFYDNADGLDESRLFMEVSIYAKDDYEEERWEETQYRETRGIDFREDGHRIARSGEYVLRAAVFQEVEDEDPSEIASAVHEFTVVAENGDLEIAYDPGLPRYIPAQEDYSLTIPFPEEIVQWMNVKISEETEDGWNPVTEESEWEDYTESHTFTFDTTQLEAVNVEIWLHAEDYNEYVICERQIPVLPEERIREGVVLSVNGEEEAVSVPINGDYQLTLTADQPIRAVRICDGDSWFYHGDEFRPNDPREAQFRNEDREMTHPGRYGWPDTYRMYAEVTFDEWPDDFEGEEDPREWFLSNIVVITAEQDEEDGNVGSFDISLDPAEVTRGSDVTVTFTEAEFAEEYWLDLWHESDEDEDYRDYDWTWDWTEEGHAAVIHTTGLPAGEYKVSAEASAIGKMHYRIDEDGRPAETLVVKEPSEEELPESGILLTADKRELLIQEDARISAYAPGAEWLELFFDWPEEGWREDSQGRNYIVTNQSYGRAGTYRLMARAWYPVLDEDGNPVQETDEDGEPVFERDEDGELWYDEEGNPQPVYRYESRDSEVISVTVSTDETRDPITMEEPELPGALTAGADALNFTVKKPENAENGHVFVNVDGWNDEDSLFGEEFDYEDESQTGLSVSLSAQELEERGVRAGDTINVNVQAFAYGREMLDRNWKIPVVEAPDEAVSLSWDDGSFLDEDGVAQVLVNRDLDATVRAADGREMQEVRFFDGYEFRWDGEWDEEDGSFHRGIRFGEPGTYSVYAMITFDEWQDEYEDEDVGDQRTWLYTDVLTIHVTKNGDVGDFAITLDPAEVTRGEKVRVTFTESEGADNYWIHDDYNWYWAEEQQRIAEIDTLGMEEGEYWIRGGADAEGLEGKDSAEVKLTVKPMDGVEEGDIILLADAEEVKLNQPLSVGIYAPGALQVGFWLDDDPWHLNEEGDYCWGESDSWSNHEDIVWRNAGDAGEHTLRACAQFEEDGEWVYGDEMTVTVLCDGELEFDKSGFPATFTESQEDAVITVKLPENAERMNIQLRDTWQEDPEDEEDGGWRDREIAEWRDLTEDAVISVPAENLAAGHEIRMDFQAWAVGYAFAGDGVTIPVVPKEGSGAVLELTEGEFEAVEGSPGVFSVPINQNVMFRVSPGGDGKLAAVKFYDGYGYWEDGAELRPEEEEYDYCFDEEGNFFAWQNYWEPETRKVFAQVLLEGSNEWFTTNVITIQAEAAGVTGPYDFDYDETGAEITVPRGEYVTFVFTPSENADRYWVDAFDEEWNSYQPETTWEGTTVTLPTGSLPEGEYTILGRAGRDEPGWQWTESAGSVHLTVTAPEWDGIQLLPGKTELLTNETLNISVLAPGAVRIGLSEDGWRHDLENGDGAYQWGETGESWNNSDMLHWNEPGTHTLIAYAQYEDSDDWAESDPVEITVTAPYGPLTMEPDVPASAEAGETLEISVPWPEEARYLGWQMQVRTTDGEEIDLLRTDNTGGAPVELCFEDGEIFDEEGNWLRTLEIGDLIRFAVWTGGLGYEHNHMNFEIPVVGTAAETVFLDAIDEEGNSLLQEDGSLLTDPNVQIRFVVGVTEGHTLSAVRFFDGYGYWEDGREITHETHDDWFDERGWFAAEQSFGESGQRTVYAMVRLDDSEEWAATNPVTVTVHAAGPAPTAEIGVAEYNLSTQDIVIGVEDPGEGWYHLSIHPEDGGDNVLDYQYGNTWTDAGGSRIELDDSRVILSESDEDGRRWGSLTLTIPAGALSEGAYELNVDFAAEGYENTDVRKTFRVVEEPAVELSTKKSRYTYGEEVEFAISAPFADTVALKKEGDGVPLKTWTAGDDGIDMTDLIFRWTADKIGDPVTFVAEAGFFDGSLEKTDSVDLRVNSLGEAPAPVVTVPESLAEGEDLNVDISGMAEDSRCRVIITRGEEEEPVLTGETEADQRFALSGAEAGRYTITVEYQTAGYDDGSAEYEVVVTHVFRAEFSWDDDAEEPACSVRVTCAECDDVDETIDAEVEELERRDPTCTEDGSAAYRAEAEYEGMTFSEEKTYVLPARDHTAVETEEEEPTCTEPGLTAGTVCEVCGETLSGREEIPALGHDWGDWQIEVEEENHTASAVRACARCDEEERQEIPVTSEVTVRASCTEAGEMTFRAEFTPEGGEPLTETWTEPIDALGHKWSDWTVAEEPTCEHTGTMSSMCARCLNVRTKTIARLGHDWNEPTYEWAADYHTVTATQVCRWDDSHSKTETVNTTGEVTKAATCEAKGETTYTAQFTNDAFVTQTKTIANIDALGHDWNEPTYEWAADYSKVTAKRTCKRDAGHVETETKNTTGEVTKAATCEAKGETTYTVTFANTAFAAQTKTAANINALGHAWGDWTKLDDTSHQRVCAHDAAHVEKQAHTWDAGKVTKKPTLTENGVKTFTCSVCGAAKTEPVALSQAEKEKIQSVISQINALVNPTAESRAALEAAKKAYAALTTDQKALVDNALGRNGAAALSEAETKVTAAEKKAAEEKAAAEKAAAEKAAAEKAAAEKAAAEKAAAEKAAAEKAAAEKAAAEKAAAEKAAAEKAAAEKAAAEKAAAEKAAADQKAASAVIDQINRLPANAGTADEAAVKAAQAAYDKLTAEQKKLVDANAAKTKLTSAQKQVTDAKAAAEKAAEEAKKAEAARKAAEEAAAKDPASAANTEKAILNQKGDGEAKNSTFRLLQAKGTSSSETAVKVTWKKVAGAKNYVIYAAPCGKKMQKLAEVKASGSSTLNVMKIGDAALVKGTYYKFIVTATKTVDGIDKTIATSKMIHVATTGGKVTNPKKVTVSKKKVKIKVKKKVKIKAKQTQVGKKKLKLKKHRAICFESDHPEIATVSAKGQIKGIAKGTATIYVYAQNGVYTTVKVTVK